MARLLSLPSARRGGRREEADRVPIHQLHAESGIATLAAVLVVPVVVFLIMSVAQFAIYYHASHLATAAAQEGVRAAQLSDGSEDDAVAQAEDFLAQAGPALVLGPTVDVTRGVDVARVEIHATAPRLVPGLTLEIHAVASGPVERFVGDVAP